MNSRFSLPILAAVLALAVGCSRAREPRRPPNILFIVVDALRQSHVGIYGYARPTTPGLDKLAREGVYFTQAYSPSYWTRPTLPSLLTGLYPSEHGLMSIDRDEKGQVTSPALSPEVETVAERLKAAGYATAMIGDQFMLSTRFGLNQGFDFYKYRGGRDDQINQAFRNWMVATAPTRYFVYLHYLDVHWPYCPRGETRGRFDPGKTTLNFCENWRALRDDIQGGKIKLTEDDKASLVARYDEEVVGLDRYLARLFNHLRKKEKWDETLVVVTADHGEEFLERGMIDHVSGLYDPLVRVPLIIKPPASWRFRKGTRIDAMVETRAVAATFLEAAGVVRAPAEGSLIPWLDGRGDARGREFVVSESAASIAVRTEDFKLMHDRASGTDILYDLRNDPGETRDVAASRPRDLARMQALLAKWRHGLQPVTPRREVIDGELEQGLKALGYVN